MAICRIYELQGGTLEQYEHVGEKVADAGIPEGARAHIAGVADGRLIVIETWESREDVDRYINGPLGAAMSEVGLPEPKITEFEVHHEGWE
jgi:hypothetical protein